MGAPQLYWNQKGFSMQKNTNLIIRLPFMRFGPLMSFLLVEFSQNWGKMASHTLRGDGENKGRRNRAAALDLHVQGSLITSVRMVQLHRKSTVRWGHQRKND